MYLLNYAGSKTCCTRLWSQPKARHDRNSHQSWRKNLTVADCGTESCSHLLEEECLGFEAHGALTSMVKQYTHTFELVMYTLTVRLKILRKMETAAEHVDDVLVQMSMTRQDKLPYNKSEAAATRYSVFLAHHAAVTLDIRFGDSGSAIGLNTSLSLAPWCFGV